MNSLWKSASRPSAATRFAYLSRYIPNPSVDFALMCFWTSCGLTLTAHFFRLGYGVAMGSALGLSG